MGQFYFGPG